jgi:RNA polymerase sigma factor (sigma-70 family)
VRNFRTGTLVAWGESCQFSTHLDVSEVSRLGLLGGTTADAGVEERSSVDRGEDAVATESRRRAASTLIDSHDAVFRRTARRYSISADDAEDAYQRALEILLTKAPPIEDDALVRWMQTVTKREALAVRRQRERLLGSPRAPGHGDDADRDPLEFIASESPGPNDRLARRERVARSGEALRALKPQEVRALTLKAQGYSYAEIGEITGWSYTKINRCMAEGAAARRPRWPPPEGPAERVWRLSRRSSPSAERLRREARPALRLDWWIRGRWEGTRHQIISDRSSSGPQIRRRHRLSRRRRLNNRHLRRQPAPMRARRRRSSPHRSSRRPGSSASSQALRPPLHAAAAAPSSAGRPAARAVPRAAAEALAVAASELRDETGDDFRDVIA